MKTTETQLSLRFLGGWDVLVRNTLLTLGSRKQQALLAYLAVEQDRRFSRQELLGLLWPEMTETEARNNLRVTLARLRSVLTRLAGRSPIESNRREVWWQPAAGDWQDVGQFDRLIAGTVAHPHAERAACAICRPSLISASDLYRGEFLRGFHVEHCPEFEEWQFVLRERLHLQAMNALGDLAAGLTAEGDFAGATAYTRRQLELDPLHDAAHRRLLRLLAYQDERAAALAHYDVYVNLLERELGVEPDDELVALARQIESGAARRSGNVPDHLPGFVGRDQELTEVGALVSEHRLLSLVGPGGIGKTSLSLQVAASARDAFPHGVWFVDLQQLDSAADLVPTLASTLQFAIDFHSSSDEPRQQLVDYFSRQQLFLVLDNFEHLLDGAGLLAEIVNASQDVRMLVTSRERLNLREEWVYPVQGLSYPLNGNGAGFETYGSLVLFAERARQVDPGFTINAGNFADAARICRLVDGLPLAIELAAAWVNVLTCKEIADEIERDIDLLTSSAGNVPDKHRSLRATFNQSWARLSPEQKVGFRQLGVFRGGFRREAAEEVAGVSLAVLSQLVQKSLIRRDSARRFELHPLAKVFAREKLDEAPEERDETIERHSRYYARYLAERAPDVQGENIREVRATLREEYDNLLAAVSYAATRWEDEDAAHETLVRFSHFSAADSFHRALATYGRLEEQLRGAGAKLQRDAPRAKLLVNVLAAQAFIGQTISDPAAEGIARRCDPLARELAMDYELGLVLLVQGIAAEYRSEYREAIAILEEARERLGEEIDPLAANDNLTWLGWAHYELGDLDQAWKFFYDSYDVAVRRGNIMGLPYSLSKLGTWCDAQHRYEEGAAYHLDAMKYFEIVGDQAGQGYALSRVSLSVWGMGDYEQALHYGRQGHEQFEALGHRWGISTSLSRIGFAEIALGQLAAAEGHFSEGLVRALEYEYPSTAIYALIGLAATWGKQGQLEQAAELLTIAIESPITPPLYKEIAQAALEEVKGDLPPGVFASIQEEARGKEPMQTMEQLRKEKLLAVSLAISSAGV